MFNRKFNLFTTLFVLTMLVGSIAVPSSVLADSTITITTNADNTTSDTFCSLREAIINANNDAATFSDCAAGSGNDTIVFDTSISGTTISGSGFPSINDTDGLTINGGGNITIDGNNSGRIFYVNGGVPLTLNGLKMIRGFASGDKGGAVYNNDGTLTVINSIFKDNGASMGGGGIYNSSNGSLTVTSSTFLHNSTAGGGGGIQNLGLLSISNSTFSANSANNGGGLFNSGYQNFRTVTNSTFSGNTAVQGGGVYIDGTLWLYNTIIADSSASTGRDCYLYLSSNIVGNNNLIKATAGDACNLTNGSNGNIIGSDPKLAPFFNNQTGYFPLMGNSPAINKGSDSVCSAAPVNNISQNGITRPIGSHCEIGSYEYSAADSAAPTITSSVRAGSSPTNLAIVYFTVTFSEPVVGVDSTDFALTTSGIVGASISSVSGSGVIYTVGVNTGSGIGTIRLDVSDDDTIVDASSSPLGGLGTGNGNFTAGETYTIEKTRVISSSRTNLNPNNSSTVNFTVTFSYNVTGVDANDFILTTNGVLGATISGVSGSGSTYTVSVNTGSGDGTIRLDITDDDTILDTASEPLGGAGIGNGDFNSGEIYTIDKTPPTMLSIARAKPNPSGMASVSFTVTFSEAVIGVDSSKFSLNTTGVTGAAISGLSGVGNTYTVTVNTGSGNGTIRLDLNDNDSITDLALNPLNGVGNSTFNTGETYNITKPNLAAPILRSPAAGLITNDSTPTFSWTGVKSGQSYEIQVSTSNTFPNNPSTVGDIVSALSDTLAPTFTDGSYFWRARAYNASNQPGNWSVVRSFTIDTTGPTAPVLTSPADNVSTSTPTFRWTMVPGAVSYQFQYDNDADFSSPRYTTTLHTNSIKPPTMSKGTYHWHVRAQDSAGNWSLWSTPRTFTISN